MGLFGKAREPQPDLQEALRKLDRLEEKVRGLATEWEDVQDKVYRWMQRTRKRDQVDAGEAPQERGPHGGAAPRNGGADPVLERIMRRRGRAVGVST